MSLNNPTFQDAFWCPVKTAHLIDDQCVRFMDQGPKSFCPLECREKMFKRWDAQKQRKQTEKVKMMQETPDVPTQEPSKEPKTGNGRTRECFSCGQIRYIKGFGKCAKCYYSQKGTEMEKAVIKPISPVAKAEMSPVASVQELPAVDFIEIRVALPQPTRDKIAKVAHELGVAQDKLTSFWVQERCAL